MNIKPPDRVLKKPICTWLSESDYSILVAAAKAEKVTLAAFVRAALIDAIEDERDRFKDAMSEGKKQRHAVRF